MPTENRSSNTEMVSVPRTLLETIRGFHWTQQDSTDLARAKARAELIDVLANPVSQPHPEPIAWMVGTDFWWTKEEAERDAAEVGQPLVGLGPMIDQGAVDQLSQIIRDLNDERDGLGAEVGGLRAQQAETRKLLTWLCNDIDSGLTSNWHAKLQNHLDGLPQA